jgi:hypothetical protein
MRPRPSRDRRRLFVASIAVIVVVLAGLASQVSSFYDVLDKGRGQPLVPYEGTGLIYKIRVLDLVNIYADEESRPTPDKLSTVGLVGAASMSLMTLLLLSAVAAPDRLRRFYAFATAGLAFLAFDELFAFHETLGHNLRFLADLPGVERPDDIVFFLYVVPLAAFAWSFRGVLLSNRNALGLFAVGTVFFGISAAADLAGVGIDEPAEVVASLCLFAGLAVITVAVLRTELGLQRSPARDLKNPDGARTAGRATTGVP